MFTEPHFQNDEAAREYLEALRWPTRIVCPHCGAVGDHYALNGKAHRPGLRKCKDCREQFSVTVGTVFERSKIPLHKWLVAVNLICSSKKGISSHQIHRMLDVTYKTAWFMTHRIREAMKDGGRGMLGGGGSKAVEVDETYWGNVGKHNPGARGGDHKMKIVSLVERYGMKRTDHVANVTAETLRPILVKGIKRDTHLNTDEAAGYVGIDKGFSRHSGVHHSVKEDVRGDATTNTAESSFAILKRGLYGTFHHVSEAHLQRYTKEFDLRRNTRTKLGFSDVNRTDETLKGISG